MRVAIIADSHFDETPGGRFDECRRIHDWIAEDLADRPVDLVLHSGDVFERKSTPAERRAVADWLTAVAEVAPVVVVRGNHDAPGDLHLFSRLETDHPVHVVESAEVVRPHLRNGERPAVACLAWPRKAQLLAQLEDAGREEGEQAAADALRHVLRGMGAQLEEHDVPRILLSHAMVRGSRVSTGQPLVGCDLEIGVEDLGLARAHLYALGHVHMPQAWEVEGAPVVYPGSPRRTAFGETEEKGYVIADFERGADGAWGVSMWQRIPTPCAPMVLMEAEYGECPGGAMGWTADNLSPADAAGAEVRFRYTAPADHREAAREAARQVEQDLRAAGAITVKVEEVVRPKSAARAPEIAQVEGLPAKLRRLWEVRDDVPEEARAERLIGRANQIEEEVRHGAA